MDLEVENRHLDKFWDGEFDGVLKIGKFTKHGIFCDVTGPPLRPEWSKVNNFQQIFNDDPTFFLKTRNMTKNNQRGFPEFVLFTLNT